MDRRMLRELELLDVTSLYSLLPVQARSPQDTEGPAGTGEGPGDGSAESRGARPGGAPAWKGHEACVCLVLGDVETGTDAARLLEAMLASIGLQAGRDYRVDTSVESGALAGVRVILALGPDAAGRARALEGPVVIRTHHPAELIAHPADKARAWEALLVVRRALKEAGTLSVD